MKVSKNTSKNIFLTSWISINPVEASAANVNPLHHVAANSIWDFLRPVRNWLDNIQVSDSLLAHRLCKYIPAQCPFERDVKVFGKTLFHIPPMCKLNPLYEEVVGLRFKAMCYLADTCGEDISQYC
ncbi:MAG: Mo-dependent nitrogenase C-terminal domain-containing protein [Nostocales cyanobacterium LE14-WE4]|nr:Mo-dependent nitrogenase C-terminal domain-containing protein [Anabaena sp. 49633_E8]MCE2700870.1 Mo-dependent nitrogenase C-terminal domain-containing protein [Anabaena sp. 49633_E8]MDJ0503261.1 Mo-dependent nitrogenase C-terminal domain-containing protein [Nostocales cyanobacterium LE14-WE4]